MNYKITVQELTESEIYQEWIGDQKVVLMRDVYDSPHFSSFIVVTKREDRYDLYRFFRVASPEIVVSADFQGVPAEEIFVKLFDKHSDRRKI